MPLVILQEKLNTIHLFLSRDLGDALKRESQDQSYVVILFLAELLAIGSLFITDGVIGHLILIYILIPILFLPARFSWINFGKIKLLLPVKFSFYNIFRNAILCRTLLFLVVFIYGADKAFLSYLYPEPVFGYLHIFFYYLLAPILAFIIATIRLVVDMPNFNFVFFCLTGPLAALNAVINMYTYYFLIKKDPTLHFLGEARLTSRFGAAMGYNANLDALIYSVFLIGLFITVINYKSRFGLIVSLPTLFILFCAILWEQSRACSLAIICSLLFYAFIWRSLITRRAIYTATILLSFILIFIFNFLPHGIATYFLRADYFRPELWVKFFNLSKENLFIGYGDRFIFEVPLSNGVIITHAHSILLTSLVRGGIIGLLSMLFITIYGLRRSYCYAKHTENAVPLCVFITVMIAGFVDFELKVWQAGWYLAGYWLAIALVVGADAKIRNESRLSV